MNLWMFFQAMIAAGFFAIIFGIISFFVSVMVVAIVDNYRFKRKGISFGFWYNLLLIMALFITINLSFWIYFTNLDFTYT